MAEIKKLQVDGADIYPVTHESAVYDNEGKSIESKYLSSVAYTEGDDIKIEGSEGGSVDTSELEAQIEEVDTKVGELSNLQTTDKDNIVGAINELFQSANNGKELIADAIGEPLSSSDTFQAMSNDINNLLSTFKTNMMNNGITVEGGDKFKALIDKIATMVEEGSGKGIQYAEGSFSNSSTGNEISSLKIQHNLGSIPELVFVTFTKLHNGYNSTLQNVVATNLNTVRLPTTGTGSFMISVYDLNESEFTINISNSVMASGISNWYAIGVGEEDTTLRDSLANILENKGVDVTEEDDMTSLITKVDSIKSGGLDIITASSLPTSGKENQICIVSSDPDYDVLVTTNADEVLVDPTIVMYLGNSSSTDVSLGTQAQIGNMMYYFNRVMFGTERLPSYMWSNNQWNELTKAYIPIFENGVVYTGSLLGDPNITTDTSIVKVLDTNVLTIVGNGYVRGFTYPTLVNFENFSKIEIVLRNSSDSYITFWVGAFKKHYTSKISLGTNQLSSQYTFNNTNILHDKTSFKTFTIDISSWTGNYYLGFCSDVSSNASVFIKSIKLY